MVRVLARPPIYRLGALHLDHPLEVGAEALGVAEEIADEGPYPALGIPGPVQLLVGALAAVPLRPAPVVEVPRLRFAASGFCGLIRSPQWAQSEINCLLGRDELFCTLTYFLVIGRLEA